MKIIVLHPKIASTSAKNLAAAIGADCVNPFNPKRRNFTQYDVVLNYGCNRDIKANTLINPAKSVAACIDKLTTFRLLQQANVPVPNYCIDKEQAKHWDTVAVRVDMKANGNKGMSFIEPNGDANKLPDAQLYTEYFFHKKEFRVVVINAITIAVYEKVVNGDEWHFIKCSYKYLAPIKQACEDAANALGIHFVGFDVVMNAERKFVILEANSAPILTIEMIATFKRLLKKFEKGLGNGQAN